MSQKNNPTKEFDPLIIKRLLIRKKYTPDYPELADFKNIPVFIYNDLMAGFDNNILLNDSLYLGDAKTCSNCFSLRNPYFVSAWRENRTSLNAAHIKGEVYCIPPYLLFDLDVYHQNTVATRRQKVNVFLEDQRVKMKDKNNVIPTIQAWMYFGIKEFWEPHHLEYLHRVAPNGDKKKQYYKFWRLRDVNEDLFSRINPYAHWT